MVIGLDKFPLHFSSLAISFLLVNPPLADIAPPTLANGIDIENTRFCRVRRMGGW